VVLLKAILFASLVEAQNHIAVAGKLKNFEVLDISLIVFRVVFHVHLVISPILVVVFHTHCIKSSLVLIAVFQILLIQDFTIAVLAIFVPTETHDFTNHHNPVRSNIVKTADFQVE
jgi:hypothetical protein